MMKTKKIGIKKYLKKSELERAGFAYCGSRQMFPTLEFSCAGNICFTARKQKLFLPQVKNIFASRTQILCLKHGCHENSDPEN